MADNVFLPAGVAAMLIGDLNSELTEEGREDMAAAMLIHLQDDLEAMVSWEEMRKAAGSDDERTVLDLTVRDLRDLCEGVVEAVKDGRLPDPMDSTGHLPGIELTELDQELFNTIAETIPQRLAEVQILSVDVNGDERVEPDFYVMLVGSLLTLGSNIETMGCLAEAAVINETVNIVMKMYALHLNLNRPPR